MTRWQMNRLGFVHFWLYTHEVFPFFDGKLLLRGDNGAGKSVTTQSFIPFMLDGDRRPERLDPFGSRDRKMDYYLLGDGAQEEATGYLYLEFKKPHVEQYRTLIIGLRARKGKSMDFWGMCLRDGRRVGEDFPLYRTVDKHLVPLSKVELKHSVGSANTWADTPGEYKKMVNDQLFQFPSLEQYEQFIRLLIDVRKPKLSKDFHPRMVTDILNQSLQTLGDNDLRSMVESMNKIEEYQSHLNDLNRAKASVDAMAGEYLRYNQYMLLRKADAYQKASRKLSGDIQTLEQYHAQQEESRRTISQCEQKLEQSIDSIQLLKQQINALGISAELKSIRHDLDMASHSATEKEQVVEQYRQQEEDNRRDLSASGRRIDQTKEELSSLSAAFQKCMTDLNTENETLCWHSHEHYTGLFESGAAPDVYQAASSAVRQYRKQLTQLIQLLKQRDAQQERTSAAEQERDESLRLWKAAEEDLQLLLQLADQQRDLLIETLAELPAQNRVFLPSAQELQAVREIVVSYDGSSEWDYQHWKETLLTRIRTPLQESLIRLQEACKKASQEVTQLIYQLEQLKSQRELTPPRPSSVSDTRSILLMRGIPHRALYEVVDFAPDLNDEQRSRTEAQLLDSGILDALLVPPEYLSEVADVLESSPDRFLRLPEHPASHPIKTLVPDTQDSAFLPLVSAFLSGISSDPASHGEMFLSPDGRFQIGPVSGWSHPLEPARFVGGQARERARQLRISAVENDLAEARSRYAALEASLERTTSDLTVLEQEAQKLPTTQGLSAALSELNAQSVKEQDLHSRATEKELIFQQAQDQLKQLRQHALQEGAQFPYPSTAAAYEEAEGCADTYEEVLIHARQLSSDQQSKRTALAFFQEQHDRLLDRRDQIFDDKKRTERELSQLRQQCSLLQAQLDSPEMQEKAKKLEELNTQLQNWEQIHEQAVGDKARAEGVLTSLAMTLRQQEALLAVSRDRAQALCACFKEELELELVLPADPAMTPEAQADAVISTVSKRDAERSPDSMFSSLKRSFDANMMAVTTYAPELEPCFENSTDLRQRYCIVFEYAQQKISLQGFREELARQISNVEMLLADSDRELFENILTNTLVLKLSHRIKASEQWIRDMSQIMKQLETSMGLTFSLDWVERKSESEQELDTKELVALMRRDPSVMTDADRQKLTGHFRSKVELAKKQKELNQEPVSYSELVEEALDYRNWFVFRLFYQRTNEPKRELTNSAFNRFSGGEKAMAMYVPLFAAVSAQYKKAGDEAPKMIALDEAFAGVDDKNIASMFQLVEQMGLGYIMNSQVLWGCYQTVSGLEIVEMYRPNNADIITTLRYRWNGTHRILDEAELE